MPCNAKYCWMPSGAGKPVKSLDMPGKLPIQNTIAVNGGRFTCKKVIEREASLLPHHTQGLPGMFGFFRCNALSVNRNVKMAQYITGSQFIPTHPRLAHYPQAVDSQETL